MAIASDSNFVLTVTGTGYVNASVIKWNGSNRTTTFVNGTNLQAPIAASDIATAGVISITVENPAADGGTSSATTFTVNNPVPTISSLSNTFVAPGGPAFTLTVNGTGFVAGSVVRWNGADRSTTFASATQLTAAIPAADIATQGVAQVSVFNASPGGGITTTMPIAIGNAMPKLTRLTPSFVRPGSAAFTLQIEGKDFLAGTTVSWNGANLATTFVSATNLQVAIPATNVQTQGFAQVVANNPAPGGGASDAATFTIAPYGVTERLSVATDGSEANGDSDFPQMSANGRFVAFTSMATNLVAGDTNGAQDIFVRDTCFGVASGCTPSTARVSVSSAGNEPNGVSGTPSISADGRYVSFVSLASNLVADDSNSVADVFVRDTCAGVASGCTPTTARVSVSTDGTQGNLDSVGSSISENGRFVSFFTPSILVLGDINNVSDVFIRDTCAGATGCTPSTTRISGFTTDSDPDTRGVNRGGGTSMSANGRYIAFIASSQCASGCSATRGRVYVYDTCTAAPAGCSPSAVIAYESTSSLSSLGIRDRELSADGRLVAFQNTGIEISMQISDTCIGAPTGCVPSTRDLAGAGQPFSVGGSASLTADGRLISYDRQKPDAIFASLNNRAVSVQDTCLGASAGCLLKDVIISETSAGQVADKGSFNSTLAGDGSQSAFASDSTNLVPSDTNAHRDIFLARTGLSH